MTNSRNRTQTATASCVDSTRARAYALFRPAAITHGPWQNTTHRSVCVMSELYYVLPSLYPCHLSQIIKANRCKKRLKRPATFEHCCHLGLCRSSARVRILENIGSEHAAFSAIQVLTRPSVCCPRYIMSFQGSVCAISAK